MQPDALAEVDPPGNPVQPETLYTWIRDGDRVTIVDLRNMSEFGEWHISGRSVTVENIPAYDFIDDENQTVLDRVPDGSPLVVVCAEGKSSSLIAGWLVEQGYDARNLADGMEGWARVYAANEVTAYQGPGVLIQYLRPSSGCLGYLLYHEGEAAVFDPLDAFTSRYLDDAETLGVDLSYAFDTHIHADHLSGVRTLGEEPGIEPMVPDPALDRGVTYASSVTPVRDGDTFDIGSATVEAIHTPGHTTGMTSYLVSEDVLLTGDGLFTESVARPDLEEGDEGAPEAARMLHETLEERILPLPDDTLIAGGHTSGSAEPRPDGTYTARLGELREGMAILGMERSEFVDRILEDMPPKPENYQEIIAANLGQTTFDQEEAFELELGPNNCATSREALD